MGDLNARSISLLDHATSANGKILEKILLEQHFIYIRYQETFTTRLKLEQSVTSEHPSLLVETTLIAYQGTTVQVIVKDRNRADWNSLNSTIHILHIPENLQKPNDIDDFLTAISSHIQAAISLHVAAPT